MGWRVKVVWIRRNGNGRSKKSESFNEEEGVGEGVVEG